MLVKETKTYKFNELPEDIQNKVIEKYYDINVDYEWWESVYDDAANINLKITEFDINRGRYAKGDFIETAFETANLIIANHGEHCETYKTAKDFITDYNELVKKYSDGININIVIEDNEYEFDNDLDDLEHDFLYSLLEDYAIILKKEYEYLTSREAIIETIEANDYDFTEHGIIF